MKAPLSTKKRLVQLGLRSWVYSHHKKKKEKEIIEVSPIKENE